MNTNALWKCWKANSNILKINDNKNFTLNGFSIAALRTHFYIKELNIGLDAGLSCPYNPDYIFITHCHSDHCASIPFNIMREELNKIRKKPVPEDIVKYNYKFPDTDKKPKFKVGDIVYRQLDYPEDALGNKQPTEKFREGDYRYSRVPKKIVKLLYYTGDVPYRYMLEGIPNASFKASQLMISKEKETKYVVKEIIGKKTINKKIHYLVWWKGYLKKNATYEPRNKLIEDGLKSVGKQLSDSTVLILGVSYKPNVKDIQITPAEPVIQKLQTKGSKIKIYDPYFKSIQIFDTLTENSIENGLVDVDVVVLITAHDEFRNIDPTFLGSKTKQLVVVDTRGVIDVHTARKAGLLIKGIGRGGK